MNQTLVKLLEHIGLAKVVHHQYTQFKEHMTASVISLVFHAVLLFLLVTAFVGGPSVRAPDIVTEMITPTEAPDLDDVLGKVDTMVELPQVVEAVKPPDVSLDNEPPNVDFIASPTAVSGPPGAGTGTGTGEGTGEGGSVGTGEGVDGGFDLIQGSASPLTFKGLYASRSAGGRAAALKAYAGGYGKSTEFAVKKALEWLKRHQSIDGSWGPQYRAAMTGLALLAFMAHGETTSSEEFGECIRRGLRFLLRSQRNGMFIGGGVGHPSQISAYEHAIATYAVSEAYGLTSIPFLKVAMEDAVQVVIDGQNEEGSWDYGYKRGPDSNVDVSLAGWHIQALKAAYGAGAENRGLKSAIESSMRGLKIMQDKKGSGKFQYSTRMKNEPPNLCMTSVAVLCMQLAGHVLDTEARAGMQAVRDIEFHWTKGVVPNADQRGLGEWPLYGWYYLTQARFHQGGQIWHTWNKQWAPALSGMQNKDGSWCPAPQSNEAGYGPVYCTALSTLMLEVYYRFLPTYKEIEVETTAPTDGKEKEEEIVIKFG
jgi:hypothetical protein